MELDAFEEEDLLQGWVQGLVKMALLQGTVQELVGESPLQELVQELMEKSPPQELVQGWSVLDVVQVQALVVDVLVEKKEEVVVVFLRGPFLRGFWRKEAYYSLSCADPPGNCETSTRLIQQLCPPHLV
jgi:hypothetical protein